MWTVEVRSWPGLLSLNSDRCALPRNCLKCQIMLNLLMS